VELAVVGDGTVGQHVPENGISLGREALGVGAVRDRRQQMERELRLLVMPHLHVIGRRDGGDPSPLGWATTPGGVEVAHVDRPVDNQIAHAHPGVLALTGGYR